jgi:cytochrome c biogenesis protein CcmG/thiol:disulfide interchange protein DsbE
MTGVRSSAADERHDDLDGDGDGVDAVDEVGTGAAGEAPRRSHLARNVALVVGAVLVLLIAVLATRKPPGERTNQLIGHRVPELAGPTLDGRRLNVDSLQGKWVVVNFLASWCIGCVEEHPDLLRFAQAHPDDVKIVGVAYNDDADSLRRFFEVKGGDWPVILPERRQVPVDFGVTGVPETFMVRPDGIIVAWSQGVTYDWMEQVLATYRDPAPPTTGAAR